MAGGRGSPLVPVLAAAAAVVLGLAIGAALLGQRGTDPGGVATQPSPTASPAATGSPGASPAASPEGTDRIWVFFSRDQLPAVGAYVRGTFDDSSAEQRISSRITALHRSAPGEAPAGASSAVKSLGRNGALDMTVRVEGDLATLEFGPDQFGEINGSSMIGAVLEELVYTASEELGIRRVLLAERGKSELEIGGHALITDPLTREDVMPYTAYGVKTEERIALEDDPRPSTIVTRVDDTVPGLTRFVIEMKAKETPAGGFWSPRLTAELAANLGGGEDPLVELIGGLPGKWVLKVQLPGASDPSAWDPADTGGAPPKEPFERSPVRSLTKIVGTAEGTNGTTYLLGLDDARPWRISLEPGQPGTMRLNVDIGGHPQAVSDSIAVYEPRPVTDLSERTFTLRGAARAFEAHVSWRLVDSNRRELATGSTTASLGTSPVWGTFETEVQVPADAIGSRFVHLEVFWPSPRDRADVGTVGFSIRFP